MLDPSIVFLEKRKKELAHDALYLRATKQCIENYNLALKKSKEFNTDNWRDIVVETYKCILSAARSEWGPTTVVDDYSVPGRFIIRSGKKEEII